jgi:hypothetical protein
MDGIIFPTQNLASETSLNNHTMAVEANLSRTPDQCIAFNCLHIMLNRIRTPRYLRSESRHSILSYSLFTYSFSMLLRMC